MFNRLFKKLLIFEISEIKLFCIYSTVNNIMTSLSHLFCLILWERMKNSLLVHIKNKFISSHHDEHPSTAIEIFGKMSHFLKKIIKQFCVVLPLIFIVIYESINSTYCINVNALYGALLLLTAFLMQYTINQFADECIRKYDIEKSDFIKKVDNMVKCKKIIYWNQKIDFIPHNNIYDIHYSIYKTIIQVGIPVIYLLSIFFFSKCLSSEDNAHEYEEIIRFLDRFKEIIISLNILNNVGKKMIQKRLASIF